MRQQKSRRLRDHEYRSQLDDKSKKKATQAKTRNKMKKLKLKPSVPLKLQQMPQSHRTRKNTDGKRRKKRKEK